MSRPKHKMDQNSIPDSNTGPAPDGLVTASAPQSSA